MSPEHSAPASHRAMAISVIVAAVALTVFAAVGTALMLGWIHPMAGGVTPASFASPAQQVTGTAPDTRVRRMAVHVEDHPLSYGGFEGVIPKGQYGAGTVIVWDRGTWVPVGDPREGYRSGKLKFELHGEKLRGRWNLVRMGGHEQER